MLGFYPLSTHPISQLADSATPYPPVVVGGSGDDGADSRRYRTAHEKRRRKRHAAQMADWSRQYQALLDGPDTPQEVATVARVVARQVETAQQPGALARGVFAQFFEVDASFRAAPQADQGAQLADVARRLRAVVAEARRLADEEDEEAAIALLLM